MNAIHMERPPTEEEFKKWADSNKISLVESAHGFKVGDKVIFTNDAGVSFSPRTIFGIEDKPRSWGGQFYIHNDAWWHPAKLEQIKLIP